MGCGAGWEESVSLRYQGVVCSHASHLLCLRRAPSTIMSSTTYFDRLYPSRTSPFWSVPPHICIDGKASSCCYDAATQETGSYTAERREDWL